MGAPLTTIRSGVSLDGETLSVQLAGGRNGLWSASVALRSGTSGLSACRGSALAIVTPCDAGGWEAPKSPPAHKTHRQRASATQRCRRRPVAVPFGAQYTCAIGQGRPAAAGIGCGPARFAGLSMLICVGLLRPTTCGPGFEPANVRNRFRSAFAWCRPPVGQPVVASASSRSAARGRRRRDAMTTPFSGLVASRSLASLRRVGVCPASRVSSCPQQVPAECP